MIETDSMLARLALALTTSTFALAPIALFGWRGEPRLELAGAAAPSRLISAQQCDCVRNKVFDEPVFYLVKSDVLP